MTGHLIGIVLFLTILLCIAISNLLTLPRLETAGERENLRQFHFPRTSILLPVRDEAENAEACLKSLLAQEYPDFEVLVLDDHSQDRTPEILADLARQYNHLKVIQGRPLPSAWAGKQWACQQLAESATGEVLLFTDADTRHHARTLKDAVTWLETEQADLLSALPAQKIGSLGEILVVPLLYWSFLGFMPLALARRLRAPALSFAIGQFLLFRRRSFQAVGGFSSARATPADDLAIARRIREAGMRWSLVDGGNRVTCRMYHGFQDAFSGISKNLFAAFGYRIIPFLFVWSWLGFVFLAPPILLTMSFISTPIQDWVFLLNALAVLEAALLWLLVTIRFRFPLALILLYPFVISVAILIAIRSLALTLSGRASWKGRRLPRPSIRLW